MTPLLIKQIDKANHFIVGYLIYAIFFIFIKYWALIPLVTIAVGKEIIDAYKRKLPFDFADCIYTMIGGIPIFLITLK